jgi:hypothetical protein
MSTMWEYCVVTWEAKHCSEQRSTNVSDEWWEQVWRIRKPRKALDERRSRLERGQDTDWFLILHLLGREGWELVTTTIPRTALFREGNLEVASPISLHYTFKRPTSDDVTAGVAR